MATFRASVEEGVFQNLYHSFEKGTKGKYQTVIDRLLAEGLDQLKSISDAINEAAAKSDDIGVIENVEGLTTEEMEFVKKWLSDEAVAFMREIES